jgi:hypothetical protein
MESVDDYVGFDSESLADFLPTKFLDLNVSSFGNIIGNPFLKIKEKVLDHSLSFDLRTQALRYLQKIPRFDRYKHCIQCCIDLLLDQSVPLSYRYFFFSNNEKYLKLDYEIVNACHVWFFENYEKVSSPLLYKILSAKYILCQIPVPKEQQDNLHSFFASIATNKDYEVCYRADCADVLKENAFTKEMRDLGKQVIEELGNLYNENKVKTIYTNSQNVHTESINKQTISVLRMLISEYRRNGCEGSKSDEIYKEISKDDDASHTLGTEKQEKVKESFRRIMIDPSRYEGVVLADIMLMVWEKIKSSPDKSSLITRLKEEFLDMASGGCSSGYLVRLLNILSGFYEDFSPVKITMKEQLRNEIFAHFNLARKSISKHEQEQLALEMIGNNKDMILEFISIYSPRDELEPEWVPKHITKEEFEVIWKLALHDYFGL